MSTGTNLPEDLIILAKQSKETISRIERDILILNSRIEGVKIILSESIVERLGLDLRGGDSVDLESMTFSRAEKKEA